MRFQALYDSEYDSQSSGEDVDMQIMEEQLAKYYTYINKDKKNPAYKMMERTLNGFADGLLTHKNMTSLVRELTEIFNMLKENNFAVGKAIYPGPGTQFKKMVSQYLGRD